MEASLSIVVRGTSPCARYNRTRNKNGVHLVESTTVHVRDLPELRSVTMKISAESELGAGRTPDG